MHTAIHISCTKTETQLAVEQVFKARKADCRAHAPDHDANVVSSDYELLSTVIWFGHIMLCPQLLV